MATAYEATIAYNTGGGLKYSGLYKDPQSYAGRPLQWNLNRVAGTLDASSVPTLDAQGAANRWAGTTGKDLIGALNYVAGITNPSLFLDLNGVCNLLGGTPSTLDSDGASAWF